MRKYFQLISLLLITFLSNSIFAQNVEIQGDSVYLDAVATINRAYSLPGDVGIDGQVITTNGAGQSSWESLPPPGSSTEGTYVYQIPFVCGYEGTNVLPQGIFATRSEGQYMTSIMLNNPALDTAMIDRQVVLLDFGEFSGPSSGIVQPPADTLIMDTIPRFYSLELTCAEIDEMLEIGLGAIIPPIDGYVILESDQKIKVSVIYTYFGKTTEIEPINQGGGLGVGQGHSIDTEQIEPIFVPSLPDE